MSGTTQDIAYANYQLREKYKNTFLRIFKIPLDKKFWHPLFGLNAIAFDEFIDPEKGESTYEAIEHKYSVEGVEVIKNLLVHT